MITIYRISTQLPFTCSKYPQIQIDICFMLNYYIFKSSSTGILKSQKISVVMTFIICSWTDKSVVQNIVCYDCTLWLYNELFYTYKIILFQLLIFLQTWKQNIFIQKKNPISLKFVSISCGIFYVFWESVTLF